jgi:hypothetical protein
MGIFKRIHEVARTQGGQFFLPGNYVVQVLRVKHQESRVSAAKSWFIVETRILESDNPDVKVNSEPSWMVALPGDWPDLALGNVKDFILAGYEGLARFHGETGWPEEDEINEEHVEAVAGREQLFAGLRLTAKAFNKRTRKDAEFTRVKWGVITESVKEKQAS